MLRLNENSIFKALTAHSRLYLTVQPHNDSASDGAHENFGWLDIHGRPTSPPLNQPIRVKKSGPGFLSANERKVKFTCLAFTIQFLLK